MKREIDNLLARYFGGNASPEDMIELENWISLSVENQLFFDKSTILYEKLYIAETIIPSLNTFEAKKKFKAYINMPFNENKKVSFEIIRKPFYKKWMFQAASIALLMILSFVGWKVLVTEHEMTLSSQMAILQDVLPDSTLLTLSKNSTISYNSNFGKTNKILKLEGEAKFAVGQAGIGSLQVQALETYIEDIGTVFDVKAYPQSNFVSVKVREGEVKFYTQNNNGIMLKFNETGVYNRQTKSFEVLAQKLNSKTTNGAMHIQFQGMELNDAIEIISNAYNVNIVVANKSIGLKKITVNFDAEEVNTVLEIIAETLNLNLKKESNIFSLSNKSILE